MVDAFVVRAAIRRAHRQYGKSNVRLSSQFAKLLAENSLVFKTYDRRTLQAAFLAPVTKGSYTLNESNAMWFLPTRRMCRAVFADGLVALNRTRRQCALPPVRHAPPMVFLQTPQNGYRAAVARSITRYFYSKHYMRATTLPGQTTLRHIEALLSILDEPYRRERRPPRDAIDTIN